MKILLTTYGSRGDVQPMLALAVALQSKGHSILLAGTLLYPRTINRHRIKLGLTPIKDSKGWTGAETHWIKLFDDPWIGKGHRSYGVKWKIPRYSLENSPEN